MVDTTESGVEAAGEESLDQITPGTPALENVLGVVFGVVCTLLVFVHLFLLFT